MAFAAFIRVEQLSILVFISIRSLKRKRYTFLETRFFSHAASHLFMPRLQSQRQSSSSTWTSATNYIHCCGVAAAEDALIQALHNCTPVTNSEVGPCTSAQATSEQQHYLIMTRIWWISLPISYVILLSQIWAVPCTSSWQKPSTLAMLEMTSQPTLAWLLMTTCNHLHDKEFYLEGALPSLTTHKEGLWHTYMLVSSCGWIFGIGIIMRPTASPSLWLEPDEIIRGTSASSWRMWTHADWVACSLVPKDGLRILSCAWLHYSRPNIICILQCGDFICLQDNIWDDKVLLNNNKGMWRWCIVLLFVCR